MKLVSGVLIEGETPIAFTILSNLSFFFFLNVHMNFPGFRISNTVLVYSVMSSVIQGNTQLSSVQCVW